MDDFVRLCAAIGPVVTVMALGFGLARTPMLGPEARNALNRLVFWVVNPAFLLDTFARKAVPLDGVLTSVLVTAGLSLAGFLVALALTRHLAPDRRGTVVASLIRPNGALLGLPVVILLARQLEPGSADRLTMMYVVELATVVLVTNVLGVLAFTIPHRGFRLGTLGPNLRDLARNPVILACLLGVSLALAKPVLATVAVWSPGLGTAGRIGMESVALLGQATVPMALLVAGAGLDLHLLRNDARLVSGLSFLRLVLIPALALALGWLCGLTGEALTALVVILACPVAITAVPMARELGGDDRLMATLVVATTLVAPLTMLLWLVLLLSS